MLIVHFANVFIKILNNIKYVFFNKLFKITVNKIK